MLDYEQLNETVPEGTVLNYQCDSGYSIFTSENLTCNSAGMLNPGEAGCYGT